MSVSREELLDYRVIGEMYEEDEEFKNLIDKLTQSPQLSDDVEEILVKANKALQHDFNDNFDYRHKGTFLPQLEQHIQAQANEIEQRQETEQSLTEWVGELTDKIEEQRNEIERLKEEVKIYKQLHKGKTAQEVVLLATHLETFQMTGVVDEIKRLKDEILLWKATRKNDKQLIDKQNFEISKLSFKFNKISEVMKRNDVVSYDYDNTYLTEEIKSILEDE